MQTYLPYPDFEMSLKCLDLRRLSNQRVTFRAILNALEGYPSPWTTHPIVILWRGYEECLENYAFLAIREFESRGHQNNMKFYPKVGAEQPWWMGDERFHASHRAALLSKNPEWYGQFGWTEEPKVEFEWPLAWRLDAKRKRRDKR